MKQDFTDKLTDLLGTKYGFTIQSISAANRGFCGETWKVHTDNADYFVKIDRWTHHMISYQNSLAVIQFMTDNGISFIPQIIKTKKGELYSRLAQVYRISPSGIDIETETFGTEVAETFLQLQNEQKLPDKVIHALHDKQTVISKYIERPRWICVLKKIMRN